MAEDIVIGRLVIDSSDLQNSMAQSKRAIIDLENEQKKLKKDTDNLTQANDEQLQSFVDNEAQLKKLRSEYSANQKSVLDLTKAQTGLDDALKVNVKTQKEAEINTKALIDARKQIDATTVEGAKAIEQINSKINANNKFLNENNSELEKQKVNIGNYPTILGAASDALSKQGGIYNTVASNVIGFKTNVTGAIDTVSSINSAVVNTAKNIIGFGNASKIAAVQSAEMAAQNEVVAATTTEVAVAEDVATASTWGLNAALAVLLIPITAIAVIAVAVYNVFKDYAPVVNYVKDAFASLSAIFTVLKTGILDVVTGAKSLGDVFGSLGSDIATATVETYKLEGAQRALTKAMDIQELASARTATRVKELILQSKDLSKSAKERQDLINEAQKLEENEFNNRFKNYKKEKDLIIERLAVGKNLSEEDKARLTEGDYEFLKSIAKKKKLDGDLVEAFKKNQLSRESLLQEDNQIQEKAQNYKNKIIEKDQAAQEKAAEKATARSQKLREADFKQQQSAIDALKLEDKTRSLSTEQRLANLQKIFDAENKLAEQSLTGSDLQKKQLENAQELSTGVLALADAEIQKEADKQKRIIDFNKATTAEIYDEQSQSAELLAKAQIALLDKKLLSEKAYADEVVKINGIKNEALAQIQANFDAQEKLNQEKAAADAKALSDVQFQIKLQDIADKDATEAQIKQDLRKAEYDKELEDLEASINDKKITEGVYLAQKELAEKKFRAASLKDEKTLAEQKKAVTMNLVKGGLNALGELFEGSKAIAVAQALVNTFEGISAGVKLGYPAAIPAVAFAAASGFAAVKNILKTNKNSSSGDSSTPTPSTPTTSNASSFVNTAQTETIARVTDRPVDQNTIVSQPVLILESLHEAQDNLKVKIQSS